MTPEQDTYNTSSLKYPLSIKATATEFSSYPLVWKIGLSLIIIVLISSAMVPIIMVFLNSFDSGGIMLAIVMFLGALYGLYDMFDVIRTNTRLKRFASDNRLLFSKDNLGEGYHGAYFRTHFVRIAHMIRTPEVLFTEFGNIRIVGQQDRSSSGQAFGYVRMKLPRRLPHMFLQTKKPMSLPVPGAIDTKQQLGLEGNFNDIFTLYAPKGYERDVLYIFTPNVMEKFIELAGAGHCEIIDDEIYFYSRTHYDLTSSTVIKHLLEFSSSLRSAIDHQVTNYSDDRIDSSASALNDVQPDGRTLRISPLQRFMYLLLGISIFFGGIGVIYFMIRQSTLGGAMAAMWHIGASSLITVLMSSLIGFIVRWWLRPRA